MNPLNLALRFLLELAALGALGWWGATLSEGWLRWVLAIALPLFAAAMWGTFAVPDDPSRGGTPVVVVPGWTRLALELAFFAAAVLALRAVEQPRLALITGGLVTAHYLLSLGRIGWLLAR